MPHLQFETTAAVDSAAKHAFTDEITDVYADRMATGTGHVAVTVRALENASFSLGRLEPGEDAVMLNADVRAGRSFDRQRSFVRDAFEVAHGRWGVPTENMYAVVTEHGGEQFHEYDRVLSSWGEHEAEDSAD
ncbi:tautomerase [Natrinema sp. 74]|uniref:tautomerase n=1 Tax=Natrinema sp. 74 TaxID=3384159 RepID=UPI0038D4779C